MLRASDRTTNSFTSVTTTGRFDATEVNVANHNDCEQVDALYGHPGEVALQLVTSTGLGTNGSYDTLPERCGLAIPQSMIDTFESLKAINTVNRRRGH